MMSTSKSLIFITIGMLGTGQALLAEEWNVMRDSSSVKFIGIQQGSAFEGRFQSFSAEVDFDPADPTTGQINGVVEPATVNSGDSERDATLLDRDWFDPTNHPEATFESESIEALDDGSYRAHAQLTLRGATNPVTMDFTFEESETSGTTQGRLSGTMEIRRLDFGVGQGFWTDTAWVANEVTVQVELDLQQ